MDPFDFDAGGHRAAGPLILGVPWQAPQVLLRTAGQLAAALDVHVICAYVDPASYLTEWEPPLTLTAASLDPAVNQEALYPAAEVRRSLEEVLGTDGAGWSFRVLNGDVSSALIRLAESTGASMFLLGRGQRGFFPRISRSLEGSVSDRLTRMQSRPVVIVPTPHTRIRRVSGLSRRLTW